MTDQDLRVDFGDLSEETLKHPIVQNVISELLRNLKVSAVSLPAYGIEKVAAYAAIVARAQALGLDPDVLKLPASAANPALAPFVRAIRDDGTPVFGPPEASVSRLAWPAERRRIGIEFRQWAVQQRVSLKTIAEDVGTTPVMVSLYERGAWDSVPTPVVDALNSYIASRKVAAQ